MILRPLQTLGNSDLQLSPIGLGTWLFSGTKGISARFWRTISDEDIKEIIAASAAAGINWVDTTEAYGNGYSEQIIAKSFHALERENTDFHPPFIADKWWPIGRKANSIESSIHIRLKKLEQRPIDLYQIHHPTSFSSIPTQMTAMAQLIREKK